MGLFGFSLKKDFIRDYVDSVIYGPNNKSIDLFYEQEEVTHYPLALHWACYASKEELIKVILSKKSANINIVDSYNQNALHYLLNEWRYFDNFDDQNYYKNYILKGFQPTFSDADNANLNNKGKWKDFKMIISILDLLVKEGINIEQESELSNRMPTTPIYYPFASQNRPVINRLIYHDVKLNHIGKDSSGYQLGLLDWFDLCFEEDTVSNKQFRELLENKGAISIKSIDKKKLPYFTD